MKTLQRLAIVCFEDPRHVTGGVQRRVASEIEYFARCGMEIVVICEGRAARQVDGTVTYISVPTPPVVYPVRTLIFAAKASRLLRALPAFDVIETHHDSGAAVLLAYPFRKPRSPAHVEVVHGVFRDEWTAIRRYENGKGITRASLSASGLIPLALIEHLAARRADMVLAVSEYCASKIVGYYGVPRERIYVVPNGIDAHRYSPLESKPDAPRGECSILFVGRWHARKGVMQLIEAFGIAHTMHKGLRLRLVGSGPQEIEMRSRIEHLGLLGAVDFLGPLDDRALLDAYRTADIVCVPSLQEGQGIAALEAQACGAPVVATRAGGLAEAVLDRQTGMIVPVCDTEALAHALAHLASDPTLRQQYSRNAVQWARSFAWEGLLTKQAALYAGFQVGTLSLADALESSSA